MGAPTGGPEYDRSPGPEGESPAPHPGHHNAEVLAELLGYDRARVDVLAAEDALLTAPVAP